MRRLAIFLAGLCSWPLSAMEPSPPPGLVSQEFIYEKASFPSCHASTIVETTRGLVAAWFGGTDEGSADVGIWVAHRGDDGWSAPAEVANGIESPQKRYPCWNPVLFEPKEGPLLLFYKVGPSPREWWGVLKTSNDHGKTWSDARRLPDGILGPVRNKPLPVSGGALLCGSSTEHAGWRVHFEWTTDLGRTWSRTDAVHDGKEFGAIQPTLLRKPDGSIVALCRSQQGTITQVSSGDGGRTWGSMTATELPNPNSGIDGVTLADGRHLLVYNHTGRGGSFPRGREMLNVAVSEDGSRWMAALVLEKERGEFSYPAVIQSRNGLVHITYTWKRERIRHAVIDPSKLRLRTMDDDGRWPE